MNLKFAGRFNKSELILKEFNHWVVIIRENVVTLGSCIIILKSVVIGPAPSTLAASKIWVGMF